MASTTPKGGSLGGIDAGESAAVDLVKTKIIADLHQSATHVAAGQAQAARDYALQAFFSICEKFDLDPYYH